MGPRLIDCLTGCPYHMSCYDQGAVQNIPCGTWKEISCKGGGGEGQEPISYFSIKLSHTHVDQMCLRSISVVISFLKIIFESEHYECKSRMMHTNDGNAWGYGGGGGIWHKTIWISFFYPTYNILDGPQV